MRFDHVADEAWEDIRTGHRRADKRNPPSETHSAPSSRNPPRATCIVHFVPIIRAVIHDPRIPVGMRALALAIAILKVPLGVILGTWIPSRRSPSRAFAVHRAGRTHPGRWPWCKHGSSSRHSPISHLSRSTRKAGSECVQAQPDAACRLQLIFEGDQRGRQPTAKPRCASPAYLTRGFGPHRELRHSMLLNQEPMLFPGVFKVLPHHL